MAMKMRYRINLVHVYDGCIPISVYEVQVSVPSVFDDRWCGVKQFRHRAAAERLLAILNKNE